MKHFLSIADLSPQDTRGLLELAGRVKGNPAAFSGALRGKTLALLFQKPSTRTRVSFEVGMYQLGGLGLFLNASDLQIGRGETVPDSARTLSRYVDGIMARVFAHEQLQELARHSRVPVINGLSDLLHPCQGMADYFTILEKRGSLERVRVAYIGDGNNVAHSLIFGAANLGADLILATPPDYAPQAAVVQRARETAGATGASITLTADPREAARDAEVIYTDVWTSMGQEAEAKARLKAFAGFQVDSDLMALARPGCYFMHCLPAHRGEEVSDAVMESPASIVFDQAENRLHVQKAILIQLLGES